jgi:hypothetical protein
MLGPLDDTLWHQLPTTFDHVGTSDPRFFDRYWFAIYDPAGSAALQVTLGVYSNMDVVDGGAVAVRGTRQYNLRVSRALRPRFEAEVGPLRIEPQVPLERLRISLSRERRTRAEPRMACELEFQAILPPEEERAHFERARGRVVQEYQRFNQVGLVSGWLELDGERSRLERWWSARDHSWGVRPGIGISEPITGPAPVPDQAGTLFLFLFFSTAALAGHVQIAERGTQRTYLTGLIRERAHPQRERSVRDAKLSFALVPGTRRFSSANLELVLDDGRGLRLELEPQGNAIAMPGLGYGGWNDGKGLGAWRGAYHEEGEIWMLEHPADVRLPDGRVERPVHRIAPVRVASDLGARDTGTGSLTFIALGRLPQYGLED